MAKTSGTCWFFFIILFLVGCGSERPTVNISKTSRDDAAVVGTTDQQPILRVAVGAMISPEITRHYYQELFELIAARIGRQANLVQRRTYAEVNKLVEDQEVALAFVCSGAYTTGQEDFGMELLVVPVVNGGQVYHSYILVNSDSEAVSLEDLRGSRFAFTDPNSNTGYMVPRDMLLMRNETPETFFQETFFTYSHDNSIKAVARGLADGAAVDSLIWEFLDTVDSTDTSRTRVVGKSPPFGIPPIVVHPDLDPSLKERLRSVLLKIHEDEEAAVLLGNIQIERFAEGRESMYDTVRELRIRFEDSDTGNRE